MKGNSYKWKTYSIIKETEDAITIIFDNHDENFSYKSGQFINLHLIIDAESVSRSYSLCSTLNDRPAITIKRVQGGKMSQYIFENAEKIKQWEIDGPYGTFYVEQGKVNEHIVLIAGGSGITPLYSILNNLLKYTKANIYLINCNKSWNDVIFSKSITYLERKYNERFKVQHFLSRQLKEEILPCSSYIPEKLSKLYLKKCLKKWLSEKIVHADYYICGPSRLIEMVQKTLVSLEIPDSKVHSEYFSTLEQVPSTFILPQTVKEVLLHFFEQSNLLEVLPNKSILETALDDKIPLPYSCKSGTCGKCAGKLISGKVHMKQNYSLTEEYVKNGFVLLCQSHPLDDEVTLLIE